MINVPRETLGGTQDIALSDTYRYISVMPNFGFQTISYWRSRGIIADNIFGQGYHDFSVTMIPCSVNFSGTSTRIIVSLRIFVSNSKNHTFRWAVTSERMDGYFLGSGPAPSDPRIKGQGTFTPSHDFGSVHWQSFSFSAIGLPNTFYVYIWRNNTGYGNCHVSGPVTVTVYKESDQAEWRNATPYVWDGSQWRQATMYMTIRNTQDQRVWSAIN